MKQKQTLQRCIQSAAVACALASSAGVGLAQNTDPTNTFDNADSTLSFKTWWGPPSPTMTWDGTLDAGGNPNSGSVRYEEPFTGTAAEQFMTYFTIGNRWQGDNEFRLDATTYTNLSFDIKVDPSSGQRKANNDYGYLEIGLMQAGESWPPIDLGGRTLPLSATAWTHFDLPVSPALVNLDKVTGFFFKMWSDSAHTNSLVFNVDNVRLAKPPGTVIIPPPKMDLAKAGVSGVQITMDTDTAQWQRDAIATPAGTGPYLWASQGSYPVTYSLTITNFPDIARHAGFEAHMYIANEDTAPANSATSGSPDWGVPDIFILRIENRVTTVLTTNADTTITTNVTYDVSAQIQWKTNFPNANATNVALRASAPSAVGTWTVTFTDLTNGILTGPGLAAANFTLPEDVVLSNFSPAASFLQFGIFKADGPNDGHNNQASGTFSHVKFTGAVSPFDDDFGGPTLTNKYVWRKTSASAVQHIPPGSAWLVGWTLPADGFLPESAPAVTGPWSNAGLTNTYTGGGKVHVMVPSSALPAGNSTLFRLIKRPFVKLQVLLPGETAAPNTASGKTGTPDPQTAGAAFNVTVNAVDALWNRVKSTDTIKITSSDTSATLPADAALVNGTATFNVMFGTAGTWTITATDVTDATKTPSTSTAITVP